MEIRYLNQEEKVRSRILYEECFPEDSEEFVTYYYSEKCRDNQILAAFDSGEMISMIHLNPFTVSLCGNTSRVHYIVAVATTAAYRRRGIMLSLMRRALQDLNRAGEPFAFLMPANPDYYYSSGFEYWGHQIQVTQDQGSIFLPGFQITEAKDEDCGALAEFANAVLSEHFDLFIARDENYYRRLIREQESQNGKVVLLKQCPPDGGAPEITGSFCYAREGGMEIREPVLRDSFSERIHPVMMGRILNLQRFCHMMKCTGRIDQTYAFRDSVIEENNGVFRIRMDEKGGRAKRLQHGGAEESMDIAVFAGMLFDTLRIYINEIV